MIKKIKMFIERYILHLLSKLNPAIYSFLYYHGFKLYHQILNHIKYKDRYFFYAVNIENTRYCNRKCSYCPNSLYETPDEYMDEAIFNELIAQLRIIKYTGIVAYVFYGEPLVDRRLEKFVEYAHKELPDAIQVIHTNGDYLTMDRALSLLEAGLDKFVVTIHDADPSSSIKRLNPIREKLHGKIILTNSDDIEVSNIGGLIDTSKYKKQAKYKYCPAILNPVITLNGDVLMCSKDYHRKHVMGNIMKENIVDIWKGSYKQIREELLAKNNATLDICKKCLLRE